MASGALPPALPMVKIGTDYFWDGGIVSNTPLQHLLDQDDKLNTLVFQVDLFSARGVLPRDIQDVLARHKDIVYSSRTRYTTDVYRRIHNLKMLLAKALAKVPSRPLNDDDRKRLEQLADLPEITILHLIYQQKAYEGHAKDYEFSGTSHARALAERLRRYTPHAQASGMDGDAAAGFRRAGPRRAPPAGRLSGTKALTHGLDTVGSTEIAITTATQTAQPTILLGRRTANTAGARFAAVGGTATPSICAPPIAIVYRSARGSMIWDFGSRTLEPGGILNSAETETPPECPAAHR